MIKSLKSLNSVSSRSPSIKYTGHHTQAPKTLVIKKSKLLNNIAVNSGPQTRANLPLYGMKVHVPATHSPGGAQEDRGPGLTGACEGRTRSGQTHRLRKRPCQHTEHGYEVCVPTAGPQMEASDARAPTAGDAAVTAEPPPHGDKSRARRTGGHRPQGPCRHPGTQSAPAAGPADGTASRPERAQPRLTSLLGSGPVTPHLSQDCAPDLEHLSCIHGSYPANSLRGEENRIPSDHASQLNKRRKH